MDIAVVNFQIETFKELCYSATRIFQNFFIRTFAFNYHSQLHISRLVSVLKCINRSNIAE